MEVSNKTILALLVATVVISLGGTYISLSAINDRLTSIGLAPITGFAVVPNATATVTITGGSSIRFTAATITFGEGSVDVANDATNCTLSTLPGSYGDKSGCSGFTTDVNHGLTIENDGNTNLSVTLRTNVTPGEFIGIDSALFLWNVTLNQSESCVNSSSDGNGFVDPNTTSSGCRGHADDEACGSIFENVSNTAKIICPRLLYDDDHDALNIDINISIPFDAPLGAKLAGFIVQGTRDPTG